jgi:hypothetical protein
MKIGKPAIEPGIGHLKAEHRMGRGDQRHMTAKRKPKKAALVLADDDRAVLSSLPDDERARSKIRCGDTPGRKGNGAPSRRALPTAAPSAAAS